jgi:hypothetical protein
MEWYLMIYPTKDGLLLREASSPLLLQQIVKLAKLREL